RGNGGSGQPSRLSPPPPSRWTAMARCRRAVPLVSSTVDPLIRRPRQGGAGVSGNRTGIYGATILSVLRSGEGVGEAAERAGLFVRRVPVALAQAGAAGADAPGGVHHRPAAVAGRPEHARAGERPHGP